MRLSFETNILINPSVELLATALPFALKNDFATLQSNLYHVHLKSSDLNQ